MIDSKRGDGKKKREKCQRCPRYHWMSSRVSEVCIASSVKNWCLSHQGAVPEVGSRAQKERVSSVRRTVFAPLSPNRYIEKKRAQEEEKEERTSKSSQVSSVPTSCAWPSERRTAGARARGRGAPRRCCWSRCSGDGAPPRTTR
jgi:hypothetical protein